MSGARERMERVNRAKRAMEAALEFMCPGQTGQEVAARLLRRYGSPGALIEAGKHQLTRQGLSENNALLLSMIPDIVRHMEQQHFGPHPRLATLNAAEKYLRVCYIGMNVERFFLLALDKSGKLIECVHMQTGNEDSAPFYLKNILAEIVRTDAKAIVIAHNHPNLTPMPSVADMECTTALISALNSIGVNHGKVSAKGNIDEYDDAKQHYSCLIINAGDHIEQQASGFELRNHERYGEDEQDESGD